MAPRLRAKPATHARMQRTATQFSELEVTPSRHDEQLRSMVSVTEEKHVEMVEGIEQGVQSTNAFSWSDAGSTSNTRRSSPANISEVPADDAWLFDDLDSLDPFSSPVLDDSYLPATIPIRENEAIHENEAKESNTPRRHIDFSETASTARRSSPFGTSDAPKDIWDFQDSPKAVDSSPDTTNGIIESSYVPTDDLYDGTPRKPAPPAPAVVRQNEDESKGPSQSGQKAKKRQRAKEPIRFDSQTQEIVNVPAAKKKSTAPRLPIVRALQESAAVSSSPVEGSKRRKPRKGAKSRPSRKTKPEACPGKPQPLPPRDTNQDAPSSSPVAVLIRSSSASVETPCAEEHGAVNTNHPTSTSLPTSTNFSAGAVDIAAVVPEPKQHHRPSPVAFDKRAEPEAPHFEQHKPKRRRVSRQFSVSERGSPVMVKDPAPSRGLEHVPPRADPVVTSPPEQHPSEQRPSFLRSKSTDRQIEQQHNSAFEDIQGKPSTQWLRRLSDKEPTLKRKSSMGKKLHDEIMKSFLGHTEFPSEAPEATPACPAGGVDITHVNKQIRLTIEQLIARLDDKKAAAYNVAKVYRSGGKESLSIVRQRLHQDRDGLAVAFSSQGDFFRKKVEEVKGAVKARSQARAVSAMELDDVLAARRQAHSRVRQGLRALRDECLRDNKVVVDLS
ncbi:hypothetical protein BBK36DRAFT_1198567 [Trichoderma citrinoviride]|uniref:Uncharacterized protein n=1 Tax=Trichoderma citrinoviride TaxID=58853 RepID=A0A2T4BBX4_9HYPO|nr:hypothetical protein BBK36DRAFT_1198567 [Trichoderma citrinoviride]PTB66830.1 hypothetical protein BBK36DRAFT_1198567 [Trichoderma citrinoviride]